MNSLEIFLCICFLSIWSVSAIHNPKCTPSTGWRDVSMDERLILADIVVYGRTKQHVSRSIEVNGQTKAVINAIFEVYCVIKATNSSVKEEIEIKEIAPRDGCSGSKSYMQINKESIVALKTAGGIYEYHEVMPKLSATFAAKLSNFFSISTLCAMQEWQPPSNAVYNRCPICGIYNFTSAVHAADDTNMSPCFLIGSLLGNTSYCGPSANTVDTRTCVPADFNQTCTRIAYTMPDVNCSCEEHSRHSVVPVVEISGVAMLEPGVVATIVAILLCSLGSF